MDVITVLNNSNTVLEGFLGCRQQLALQLAPQQQSIVNVDAQLLDVDEDNLKHGP